MLKYKRYLFPITHFVASGELAVCVYAFHQAFSCHPPLRKRKREGECVCHCALLQWPPGLNLKQMSKKRSSCNQGWALHWRCAHYSHIRPDALRPWTSCWNAEPRYLTPRDTTQDRGRVCAHSRVRQNCVRFSSSWNCNCNSWINYPRRVLWNSPKHTLVCYWDKMTITSLRSLSLEARRNISLIFFSWLGCGPVLVLISHSSPSTGVKIQIKKIFDTQQVSSHIFLTLPWQLNDLIVSMSWSDRKSKSERESLT